MFGRSAYLGHSAHPNHPDPRPRPENTALEGERLREGPVILRLRGGPGNGERSPRMRPDTGHLAIFQAI